MFKMGTNLNLDGGAGVVSFYTEYRRVANVLGAQPARCTNFTILHTPHAEIHTKGGCYPLQPMLKQPINTQNMSVSLMKYSDFLEDGLLLFSLAESHHQNEHTFPQLDKEYTGYVPGWRYQKLTQVSSSAAVCFICLLYNEPDNTINAHAMNSVKANDNNKIHL